MASSNSFLVFVIVFTAVLSPSFAQLKPNFYDKVCPKALYTIRSIIKDTLKREPRMGASILRLHFHDCFVNGCDGSILLDDKGKFIGEKTALPNVNSARGFEVIDKIKSEVNKVCKANVVSCADILAVASRDSVALLGGPDYKVLVGRRDARTASKDAANNNLPAPFFSFSQLLASFQAQGLGLKDLVLLSGAHTIGFSRCLQFRDRIFNDTNIDPKFAASLRKTCPRNGGNSDSLQPFDPTPNNFDTNYFKGLMQKKGLLHSDQELFKGDGGNVDKLVKFYSNNLDAFRKDFGNSLIAMGNLKPLTGYKGEIRKNCRVIN